MKQIFKVGDRVFDIRHGWGVVDKVNDCKGEWYPVKVLFSEDIICSYEHNGIPYNMHAPLLSFTEYKLDGFSQERPKKEPEIGSLCLFSDELDELDAMMGVIGILSMVHSDGDYRYRNGDDPGLWKYCKQIKIDEV